MRAQDLSPGLRCTPSPKSCKGFLRANGKTVREVLALDPRPSYQDDPNRVYGFAFARRDVQFRVNGSALEVLSLETLSVDAGEEKIA
ncbi:MAG: hypothetical protein V8Q84_07355 [Bilophila sp.]